MWLVSDSSFASGKTLTLNTKTIPRCLSFSLMALASITSRLVTGPMSAFATGTCERLSISTIASSEPMVSHFRITPLVSVSINMDFISDSMSLVYFAMSSSFCATYRVLPGRTPSSSGDATLRPAAAST